MDSESKVVETDVNSIEVIGAENVSISGGCEPGKVCEALDYFEMITECARCGRLC